MADEPISEIQALCEEHFIPRRMIWILAVFLLSYAGTCVAWALSTATSITQLKSDVAYQSTQIDNLQKQINEKLDILIARSKQKE